MLSTVYAKFYYALYAKFYYAFIDHSAGNDQLGACATWPAEAHAIFRSRYELHHV